MTTTVSKYRMPASKKVMMRDFQARFQELMEDFWKPDKSDEYWDALTERAMALVEEFQSDAKTNELISSMVAAFLNSRE
ncbi:MAG: hypothetical protein IJ419_04640 [Agathobacter sp.]|nr:hypothetical protein [Agathobacter sp.]